MDKRIDNALGLAWQYGQIDGNHHKMWVIDQIVRVLLGDGYEKWVEEYEGDDEYEWDVGIAP